MNIVGEYCSINVDVSFENGIYLLDSGISGDGKTFLMEILKSYCVINEVGFTCVDYNTVESAYAILSNIGSSVKFVFLDNADLYLDGKFDDILNVLSESCIILLSLKDITRISIDSYSCQVLYNNDTIECEVYK